MENRIGCKLSRLRKSRGLKQKEVAAVLNVKVCTYAAYEEDRGKPSLESTYLLCIFYDISFEKLIGPTVCQIN